MDWFFVFATVLLFVAFGMGLLGGGEIPAGATMALFGFSYFLIGVAMVTAETSVNNLYAAAYKQDLVITTSLWQQKPSATQPCRVELRYDADKKKLLLTGANIVATPKVLEAICKK